MASSSVREGFDPAAVVWSHGKFALFLGQRSP